MSKKYEYKMFSRENFNLETEKMLNKFGEEGWNLLDIRQLHQ